MTELAQSELSFDLALLGRENFIEKSKEIAEIAVIKNDYFSLLADIGLSYDDIEDLGDNYDASPIENISISGSKISVRSDNLGLFASNNINKGRVIGKYSGTIIGRFINHSPKPNTRAYSEDGDIYIFATSDVHEGDEITVDFTCCS